MHNSEMHFNSFFLSANNFAKKELSSLHECARLGKRHAKEFSARRLMLGLNIEPFVLFMKHAQTYFLEKFINAPKNTSE